MHAVDNNYDEDVESQGIDNSVYKTAENCTDGGSEEARNADWDDEVDGDEGLEELDEDDPMLQFIPVSNISELPTFVQVGERKKPIAYRDYATGTVWKVSKGRWKCVVCSGKLTLCRGCGGMSGLYPHLFGSCGENVMCPNCCTLQGPDDSDRWVMEGMAVKALRVKYWGRRYHEENEDRMFVSFKPENYERVTTAPGATTQQG
jgi:hypothetical protein